MATSTGSDGRKPPTPNKGNDKKNTGHQTSSSSAPPADDGKTPQTAAWSPALSAVNGKGKTYVVDGLGLSPRYCRTTLMEACSWAQMYTMLDGNTYEMVQQLPVGAMANSGLPEPTAVNHQIANIAAAETVLSTSSGDAAKAFNAAQVHHGDALADSDREANSSDEEQKRDDASDSSSSGTASSDS